jgi:hypothetical protein
VRQSCREQEDGQHWRKRLSSWVFLRTMLSRPAEVLAPLEILLAAAMEELHWKC